MKYKAYRITLFDADPEVVAAANAKDAMAFALKTFNEVYPPGEGDPPADFADVTELAEIGDFTGMAVVAEPDG